jgi:hypothetical protein
MATRDEIWVIGNFMEKGVHVTPGLVIDGRVVSKGKVLKAEQILEMLKGHITA